MTDLNTLGLLLFGLAAYSIYFIRRVAFVQAMIVLPFLYRIHAPKPMSVIDEFEHEALHEKVDIFNLRALTLFVAAFVGIGAAGLFFALVYMEGNSNIAGYIMAFCFAYIFANYNINSSIINWSFACENELMARIIQGNADAGGFQSLGAYLEAENQKMTQEWLDETKAEGEKVEKRMIELGYDPERNYLESDESEQELTQILEQVNNELYAEKSSETPES